MTHKTNKTSSRVVKLADFDHRRLLLEEFAERRRSDRGLLRVASNPSVKDLANQSTPRSGTSNVVSLSDRASSFASIEVDELSALTPTTQRIAVMSLLQEHLAMEFGQYRITHSNRSFIIQHHHLEELISALLRVQYHINQCTIEDLTAVGIPASFVSMNLTWGVGSSAANADAERLKQRRRKRFTLDK